MMTKKELENYIYECHRQGMDDSQIAQHLGVTVDELAEKLNGEMEKEPYVAPIMEVVPEEVKIDIPVEPEKVVEETVEEVVAEEPKDDYNWMED